MDKMTIWKNIEKIMKENDVSNILFMSKLDISIIKLNDWQKGNSVPDIYMLPKIAKALNVSIDRLFESEEYEVNENNDDILYIVVSKGNYVLEKHQLNDDIINKIEIPLDLNVKNIQCHGNITCKNLKECSISTNKLLCNNIVGNVSATHVKCETISGNVACGFDVHCNEVHGSVSSGNNVHAKTIYGDVKATNIYNEIVDSEK